ncbi:hypothetical protein G7Y89_g10209 [Cudoniella acicularis]|uniref:tripeptidyl-peptidase II n=1 Tax=Cudoniella acicularis TaxID=354080 RepID=A0A8H4RET0_9HELO|nr:hypothetical protein G7Y89_g10209 [Cudoniella acicularis]
MFYLPTFIQLLSLTALVRFVAASAVFESLHSIPRGWKFVRTAKGSEIIKLRLSLKQQNVDSLYEKLMEVSTPDHAQYGMHYEGHELRSLLKPTDETSNLAISWLQDNNITSIHDDSDYILFKTNVETANKLLDTVFGWYVNGESDKEVLRTLSYSVPDEIREHINFIQPTIRFGSLKPLSSTAQVIDEGTKSDGHLKWWGGSAPTVNITCNLTITPECLLDLYNAHYKADPNSGNSIGYASFLEEYARYSDLATFEKVYAPYAVGENFTVVQFHGGLNNQTSTDDSGEANLDNQYALSVGYPNPVTEYSTGGRGLLIVDGDSPTPADNTNEPYLDFLLAITKLPNKDIPNSISISYGENEQEIPISYATQVCQLFAQLGARGKSIIFSSGDSGTGDYCLSNDGLNTLKFQPQFPATCPYVTSVGGTRYIEPEVAVFFSSGGFSNIWPRPAYQDSAVPSYLRKIGDKNKGYFNTSGRGFPDVAAQAQNFRVIDQGADQGYRGTSCAAPTFNGIISLLNSARLSSGLPTLGFLNPWLYSFGYLGLNDITLGEGTGCNGLGRFDISPKGSPVINGSSWPATEGSTLQFEQASKGLGRQSQGIRTNDDIGYTEDGSGNNQLSDLAQAMALSGTTLPQVSSGGSVNGTFHIVTSDGAGPLEALVDENATGEWSTAKSATVTTQVPGTNGNVEGSTKRSLWTRALIKMGLVTARATNVNEDHLSLLRSPLVQLAPVPSTASRASVSSRSLTTMRMVLSVVSLRCKCLTLPPLASSAVPNSPPRWKHLQKSRANTIRRSGAKRIDMSDIAKAPGSSTRNPFRRSTISEVLNYRLAGKSRQIQNAALRNYQVEFKNVSSDGRYVADNAAVDILNLSELPEDDLSDIWDNALNATYDLKTPIASKEDYLVRERFYILLAELQRKLDINDEEFCSRILLIETSQQTGYNPRAKDMTTEETTKNTFESPSSTGLKHSSGSVGPLAAYAPEASTVQKEAKAAALQHEEKEVVNLELIMSSMQQISFLRSPESSAHWKQKEIVQNQDEEKEVVDLYPTTSGKQQSESHGYSTKNSRSLEQNKVVINEDKEKVVVDLNPTTSSTQRSESHDYSTENSRSSAQNKVVKDSSQLGFDRNLAGAASSFIMPKERVPFYRNVGLYMTGESLMKSAIEMKHPDRLELLRIMINHPTFRANDEVIAFYLPSHASPTTDIFLGTALSCLAMQADLEGIKLFLQRFGPQYKLPRGRGPRSSKLLEKYVDPLCCIPSKAWSDNPISTLELAELLIHHGANASSLTRELACSPLVAAITARSLEGVKFFLDHGVNPEGAMVNHFLNVVNDRLSFR